MNTDDPCGHDIEAHPNTWSEFFDELSWREKIRKVLNGLNAPPDSGDYKYARLQLLRLWSPVSAVVVPILMLALMTALARIPGPDIDPAPVTILPDPEPIPKTEEKYKPPKDEPINLPDIKVDVEMEVKGPNLSQTLDNRTGIRTAASAIRVPGPRI